jgi:hypothetical protein
VRLKYEKKKKPWIVYTKKKELNLGKELKLVGKTERCFEQSYLYLTKLMLNQMCA